MSFADYDGDGFIDAFVANDTMPNFLFHNVGGKKFEEVGVAAGVAYSPDGNALSGMGSDFRDVNNDGLPDIWHTAVEHEDFPLYVNQGGGSFVDATFSSGLGQLTNRMTGWGNGIYDFDNDGWKDLFVARANVMDNIQQAIPRRRTLSPTRFSAISATANLKRSVPGGSQLPDPRRTSWCGLRRHLQRRPHRCGGLAASTSPSNSSTTSAQTAITGFCCVSSARAATAWGLAPN